MERRLLDLTLNVRYAPSKHSKTLRQDAIKYISTLLEQDSPFDVDSVKPVGPDLKGTMTRMHDQDLTLLCVFRPSSSYLCTRWISMLTDLVAEYIMTNTDSGIIEGGKCSKFQRELTTATVRFNYLGDVRVSLMLVCQDDNQGKLQSRCSWLAQRLRAKEQADWVKKLPLAARDVACILKYWIGDAVTHNKLDSDSAMPTLGVEVAVGILYAEHSHLDGEQLRGVLVREFMATLVQAEPAGMSIPDPTDPTVNLLEGFSTTNMAELAQRELETDFSNFLTEVAQMCRDLDPAEQADEGAEAIAEVLYDMGVKCHMMYGKAKQQGPKWHAVNQQAAGFFREALETHPWHVPSLIRLGMINMGENKENKLEEAKVVLERAANVESEHKQVAVRALQACEAKLKAGSVWKQLAVPMETIVKIRQNSVSNTGPKTTINLQSVSVDPASEGQSLEELRWNQCRVEAGSTNANAPVTPEPVPKVARPITPTLLALGDLHPSEDEAFPEFSRANSAELASSPGSRASSAAAQRSLETPPKTPAAGSGVEAVRAVLEQLQQTRDEMASTQDLIEKVEKGHKRELQVLKQEVERNRAEAAALKDEVPRSQVSEGLMMMAEQGLLVPIEDAVKEMLDGLPPPPKSARANLRPFSAAARVSSPPRGRGRSPHDMSISPVPYGSPEAL